jgi:hypothetical protein
MHPLLYLSPVFLAFEVWQLVMAERYLGIARIEQGVDPRRLPMGLQVSVPWVLGGAAGWLWILLLLTDPMGQVPALCMAGVGGLGYFLRRSAPLRWVLVILTFEGAIRIGMMLFMMGLLWRAR